MAFLGIDIGGSFLKGAVLEPYSESLVVERRTGPKLNTHEPLARTYKPLDLAAVVNDLIQTLALRTSSVEGILLSGQMHGVVLCDKEGNPDGPIITWQDNRDTLPFNSDSYLNQLKAQLTEDDLIATGNELRSGLPISTLFRLKKQGMDLNQKFPASLLSFCANQLVDTKQFIMHASDAAAHGMLDIQQNTWHEATLEAAELTDLQLPLVSHELAIIGNSIDFGCPVYTPVGDHQASLLGVALRPGELSINIATGSQVSVLSKSSAGVNAQTRPFFGDSFLRTVTHLPAGRSLNALLNLFTEINGPKGDELWSVITEKVNEVSDTNVEAAIQFFFGPNGSYGSLNYLTEENLTVGNLMRSAINAMVSNYLSASRTITNDLSIDQLVLSGGLVQKFSPLREALSLAYDPLPIRICNFDDSSLRGLHYLANEIVNN